MAPKSPNRERDGIIWLLDQGEWAQAVIAAVFGISRSRVSDIVRTVDRRLEFRMGMHREVPENPSRPPGELVPKSPETRTQARERLRKVIMWSYLRPRCETCGKSATHRVPDNRGRFVYDYSTSGDVRKLPCPALLCNDCYMKSARWTGIEVVLLQLDENGLEVKGR